MIVRLAFSVKRSVIAFSSLNASSLDAIRFSSFHPFAGVVDQCVIIQFLEIRKRIISPNRSSFLPLFMLH